MKSGGLFPAGEKEKRALARMPEGTLMCVEFGVRAVRGDTVFLGDGGLAGGTDGRGYVG